MSSGPGTQHHVMTLGSGEGPRGLPAGSRGFPVLPRVSRLGVRGDAVPGKVPGHVPRTCLQPDSSRITFHCLEWFTAAAVLTPWV